MSGPSSAREALIVEAIGDVARLIDQAQALTAAMESKQLELVRADAQLSAQLDAFGARIASLSERAKVEVVRHVARQAEELNRRANSAQVAAMRDAAQGLFRSEFQAGFDRLAVLLQLLVDRVNRPWVLWATNAGTALLAATVTWVVATRVVAG